MKIGINFFQTVHLKTPMLSNLCGFLFTRIVCLEAFALTQKRDKKGFLFSKKNEVDLKMIFFAKQL